MSGRGTEGNHSMAHEWYYSSEGRKLGPISSATLKQLAETGQLALTDLVWRQGLTGWVPASQVKGLFSCPPDLPVTANREVNEQAISHTASTVSVVSATTPTDHFAKISVPSSSKMTVMGVHVQRVALTVAALLGGASALLPWSVVKGELYYIQQIGGWWLHLLFVVPLVVAWLGSWSKTIKGAVQIPAIMAPTLAGLIALVLMLDTNVFILKARTEGKDNLSVSAQLLINETERMLTPGTPLLTVDSAIAQVTNRYTGSGLYLLLVSALSCAGVIVGFSDVGRRSQAAA
jgi:hypothetical protein